MTGSRRRPGIAASVLLLSTVPLFGNTRSATHCAPRPALALAAAATQTDDSLLLQSLRTDAVKHPGDYLTFETAIAADRFLAEHIEARRERNRLVLERGIRGYWRGKVVAVVPSLAGFHPAH